MKFLVLLLLPALILLGRPATAFAAGPAPERARDLGVRIGRYEPGPRNAITDVPGVRVGQVTLRSGRGRLVPGRGPVRTGVTAILPHAGDPWNENVPAGAFVLNGNGEACGLTWLLESGILDTPIAFTNTLSVGTVQKGIVDWLLRDHAGIGTSDELPTPVVLECDDGSLNDIRGQHVTPAHVARALDGARSGPVAEGAVGAGTGMICYEWKGGIGTSSRRVSIEGATYTVGVIVNTNHGERHTFRVLGAPVGAEIPEGKASLRRDGSIVIVLATDAPLDARQLTRLAKRTMLGLARTGAVAHHGSGDIAIAFSNGNRISYPAREAILTFRVLRDDLLDDLFESAGDCTEEAVLNALLAAETTEGRDGNTAYALPHDRLRALLVHHRLIQR